MNRAQTLHRWTHARLAAFVLSVGAPAAASADLPTWQVELGAHREIVEVAVVATQRSDDGGPDELELHVKGSHNRAVALLSIESIEDASIEVVGPTRGAKIAVVRAHAGHMQIAALVVLRKGRVEIDWVGQLSPRGDPGERETDILRTEDANGDGTPDVLVGRIHEALQACGGKLPLLHGRVLSGKSLRWSSAPLRMLTNARAETSPYVREAFESEHLSHERQNSSALSTPDSPSLEGWHVAQVRPRSAHRRGAHPSTASGWEHGTALIDGDLSTSWGHLQVGDFATLEVSGPVSLLSLRSTPNGATLPARLLFVDDEGRRIEVAGGAAGHTMWARFDPPLHTRCLSVFVMEAAKTTAIAELTFYGQTQSPNELIASLEKDRSDPDARNQALQALVTSPQGRAAIDARWQDLTPSVRCRIVRALEGAAAGPVQPSVRILRRAAEQEVCRHVALRTLGRLGPEGTEALADLAEQPSELGDEAANALASDTTGLALKGLLRALTVAGSSRRPELRRAIRQVLSTTGQANLGDAEAWLATEPHVASVAAFALAASPVAHAHELTARAVAQAFSKARAFEDVWRLIEALHRMPPDSWPEGTLRWLVARAQASDDPWMIRAASLDALRNARSPRIAAMARRLLADPVPRVRASAVTTLARCGLGPHQRNREDFDAIAVIAQTDPWPTVRARAVRALATAGHPAAATDIAKRGLADKAARVRVAAIQALGHLGNPSVWPMVRQKLADSNEAPTVRAAAVEFASQFRIRDALPLLRTTVERARLAGPGQAFLARRAHLAARKIESHY